MTSSTDQPEFAVHVESPAPIEPTCRRDATRSVLGLRGRAEHFYVKWKELEQQTAGQDKRQTEQQTQLLLDMIRLADSFDDVFRQCQETRKLRKQKAAIEAFQMTYELLKERLEGWGVYPVEIEGKAYGEVTFQGTEIPSPWTVVGTAPQGKGDASAKVVRTVVRRLWVHVKDKKLTVLRRGEVMY